MSPPVHENGPVKEQIRVPRPSALNEQLKQRINQIRQKAVNAGVTFTKIGKWEPNGCDFELEGPVDSVMEAKTQIAELVLETLGGDGSADECSEGSPGENSADQQNSPTKWVSEQMVVPESLVPVVIGPGGKRVKAMKEEFNIKMKFLGDNRDHFPNGRILNLYGNELRVHEAKQYIQQRFIERRHRREQQGGNPENGGQNPLDVSKESSNGVVREDSFNKEPDSDFEAEADDEEEKEDGQNGEDELDEQENLVDSSQQEDGEDVEEEENVDNNNNIIEAIQDHLQNMEEEFIEHIRHTNSELLKRVRQYAEHIHKREAEFKKHENALMKRLKKMELKNARLEAKLEQFKGANGNGKGRVRFSGV